LFAVMAGIAALDYKRRTGKGQHIDASQLEPLVHFIGPAVLDYTLNGRVPAPIGSRDCHAAPHNAFRCKGDDHWCAIAVTTDEEWRSFCRVLGNPAWAKSPRFATLAARKKNEDELEENINLWTARYTPQEVMTMMQKAGVAAGAMQNAEDIIEHDPQIKARGTLLRRNHPVVGDYWYTRWPAVFSRTPPDIRRGPLMGEHNHYVCTEILGISDEEFIALVNEEVIV
jgi:benzylsuccinate CoA-transferase BbsF subunit